MNKRRRSWGPTDRGMVHLIRLVLADDWHPEAASAQLRELVPDPRVLRDMARRVGRAIAGRSSHVTERAVVTVGLAMDGIATD